MRVLLSCGYRASDIWAAEDTLDSAGLETREEEDAQREALKICGTAL